MATQIKKLPHSEVEITGEISADVLLGYRKEALKHLQKEVKLDGFREGHIPENVLVKRLGEVAILEEAAEIAIQDEYPKIVKEHSLVVIGRPQVILTKIAPGNPAEFKIRAAVMPEVMIGDYKAIAKTEMKKTEEKIEVTEKDIEAVIEELRNIRAEVKKGEDEKEERILPELDDAFVKTLGDFKDVADFKEKAKENLALDKKAKARDKKRLEIVEKIVEKSEIDLPEILIESELEKMFSQFESDVARAGVKMEDYLKHIKKTEVDIRKDWRKDAEKRAKIQLIFNMIAKEEKLSADAKKVEEESAHILEHYKDAKPENVRVYVETILVNDKVFEFLEQQ